MSDKSSAKNPPIVSTPVGKRFQRVKEVLTSTPRSFRSDAGQAKNTDVRKAVAQNMNEEMLQCKMIDFLEHYGAYEVESTAVTACKEYLVEQGHLTSDDSWTKFQTSPGNMKEVTENDCFKPLGPIAESIFDYATKTGQRNNDYIFKMVPTKKLKSDIPGSNHLMDACLVEEDQTVGSWPNHKMITPMEAKKEDTYDNIKEVREQILGDCYHILCDDPRRMFIYGMTFVDRKMNVWYFSRSHSVKTRSFEWMHGEGLDFFIQFMISLAMASPEALGIDPTVCKVASQLNSKEQQYVYELDCPLPGEPITDAKLYFKTVRILSRERPLCITSRMTRVWVVRQVKYVNAPDFLPGSEEVILKDVWIDSADQTETANLRSICDAVDTFVEDAQKKYPGPDGLKRFIDAMFLSVDPQITDSLHDNAKERLVHLLTNKNYRSLFLTTLFEWDGEQTKAVATEVVETPTQQVFDSGFRHGPVGSRAPQGTGNPVTHLFGSSKSTRTAVSTRPPARSYAQRTQRRFVFKEVCTTSYELPTLGDVMDILRQAFDAVQILHLAGWVHRDISVGNILAVKHTHNGVNSFKVKLSDFEFAQEMGTGKHHADPRTGTLFFMPVEVMDRNYLVHHLRNPISDAPAQDVSKEDADAILAMIRGSEPVKPADKSWGLPDGHPLAKKLAEFEPSDDFLPVPPTATDDIPVFGETVCYNYQHDLESIWWIIIYFITTLVNHEPSYNLALQWFSYGSISKARKELLRDNILPDFNESLRPELRPFFETILNQMRKMLHREYIKRAIHGRLMDNSSYTSAHAHFGRLLEFFFTWPGGNWRALEIKKFEPPKIDPSSQSAQAPAAIASGSKRRANDDPFQSTENKKTKKK